MPPRKKKSAPEGVGLSVEDVAKGSPPAEMDALLARIEKAGGAALARYREPFGGHWVIMAALPLASVEPTPYQRELSKTHADRLATVIPKVGSFLDPIIVVESESGASVPWWTPNGMHRLAALRKLGAQTVTALVLHDAQLAYRILALNTEKAHNLRDKALEVIRMARGLAAGLGAKKLESEYAFEFEVPAYLTLGVCYEQNGRFSGGAYQPVLNRCEEFLATAMPKALEVREARAARLLALDAAVNEVVANLKEAGLKSAYLKPYVVARCNPLRFQKPSRPGQKAPRADFDATIEKMLASAKKIDASKVKPQDLAAMAGAPGAEE